MDWGLQSRDPGCRCEQEEGNFSYLLAEARWTESLFRVCNEVWSDIATYRVSEPRLPMTCRYEALRC